MRTKKEEIEKKELSVVDADFVNVSQSTVRSVEGGHVELEQVLSLSVDAERVDSTQTAAMIIRGEQVNQTQSISLFTAGQNTEINSSLVPISLSAQNTVLNSSLSGITVARDLTANEVKTVFLVSNKVEGDVKTFFDWKGVLALGAIAGGLLGLMALLKK